jgi:hypothetical protein
MTAIRTVARKKAHGRKPAKKVTIDDVWATINEVAKAHKETERGLQELKCAQAETDRLMKTNAAEADRRIKELAESMKANAAEADRRFKETAESIKANAAETDRLMKASAAEADRLIKASAAEADKRFKETDRLIKENSRQMGEVHNRLGELVEHIVLPNIMEKVKPLGFGFEHIRPRYEFTDKDFRPVAEADVLLINGKYLMVIEVKTVLKVKDVDNHVKRLETIRRHACAPYESRSFLGAVAGAVVDVAVKTYAHKKGLYVAEQSGDTLRLDVPDGFTPAVW